MEKKSFRKGIKAWIPQASNKIQIAKPKVKIKLIKNFQLAKETFNGERNALKTGKMSFTALKDAEEEKTKLIILNRFFALKDNHSYC